MTLEQLKKVHGKDKKQGLQLRDPQQQQWWVKEEEL
jgi:hypothetical protein